MCAVVIRSNLSSPDHHSYFSSQWSFHSASLSDGWLTDMQLVGREGEAWDSVHVHRAVILPLCPLLAIMERDITKEDPTVFLPEYPVELLQAFVNLIYKGFTATSAVVTVFNILELMASLGLNMPLDKLKLTREELNEVEIIGFKKHSGLEIIEVNNNDHTPLLPPRVQSSRSSLEIIPSPLGSSCSGPPAKRRRLSKIVQTPISKELRVKAYNIRNKKKSEVVIDDLGVENNNKESSLQEENRTKPTRLEMGPIEVKLECEEFAVEDFQPTTTRKRKWNRRSETLMIPTHACDFCDFKCRFLKGLEEHCDLFHSDKELSCKKCDFEASGFAQLKTHDKKRHIGDGDMICESCGFRVNNKRKMTWHKTNVHGMDHFQSKEIRNAKAKINDQDSLNLHDIGDKTLEDFAVGMLETSQSCEVADAIKTVCDAISNPTDVEVYVNLSTNVKEIGETSDEALNLEDVSIFNLEEKDTEDPGPDEVLYTDIQDEQGSVVTKVDKTEMLGTNETVIKDYMNQDDDDESNENSGKKMIETNDMRKKRIAGLNLEGLANISSEVVGFKCSAPGCTRVSRVQYTTATHALNRLKTHHGKVHKELEDSEFSYDVLYKEDPKVVPTTKSSEQSEENPLQILKKVKAVHVMVSKNM